MKKLLVGFVAFTLIFVMCSEKPLVAANYKDINTKCKRFAKFQIGDIHYRVDSERSGTFMWQDLGGKQHRLSIGCEDVDLGKIGSVSLAVTIMSGTKTRRTSYQLYKSTIEKARREKAFKRIAGGIEKLVTKTGELFILPLDKAPTQNNEPILVVCPGNENVGTSPYTFCGMNFLHTDGNYIGEELRRKIFTEDRLMDGYFQTLEYYASYKLKL